MDIMIYTLISTFIFSFFSRGIEEQNKKLASRYFLVITLSILVVVPAFRTNIGDTYVYKQSFESMGSKTFLDIFNDFADVGYYIFTFYLYKISSNPQIMIFTTALITQVCYFKFFYKYRSYLELEIFMYIASGYFFVTMNGIRQSLAAGILVLATKYLIERDLKKYLFLVIFASLFHQSALI
ncbi:MAG: EpsG family protein, partial [Clostridium perfringens]|nr:EpsG family protein [Clostridium perfringens]